MVVVTELLLGGSLRKYLLNMRPRCLDLRVAVGFAIDIARAMECLHSHGIIHRDLKPGNSLRPNSSLWLRIHGLPWRHLLLPPHNNHAHKLAALCMISIAIIYAVILLHSWQAYCLFFHLGNFSNWMLINWAHQDFFFLFWACLILLSCTLGPLWGSF